MKLEFPKFDGARLLIVGDVMLDRYWQGSTSRISPEAPVPVVNVSSAEDSPGGAGNVALNVSALGAAATLVGLVGEDEAGEELEAMLTSADIRCDFEQVADKPTITKLRVVSRHQQLIRLDFEESFDSQSAAALNIRAEALLDNADVLILSDYAKGALDNVSDLIGKAKKAGVKVLVDPKGHDYSCYRGATLLTPNLQEFEQIMGPCSSEEELAAKGLTLIKELGLEALLVTRGEHGMSLIRDNAPELHIPARTRDVFDVTGAGDTVISALGAALAAGVDLPEAVALSNIAAGLAVSRVGTVAVSGPELRREVQRDSGSDRGVMSSEQH